MPSIKVLRTLDRESLEFYVDFLYTGIALLVIWTLVWVHNFPGVWGFVIGTAVLVVLILFVNFTVRPVHSELAKRLKFQFAMLYRDFRSLFFFTPCVCVFWMVMDTPLGVTSALFCSLAWSIMPFMFRGIPLYSPDPNDVQGLGTPQGDESGHRTMGEG